MIFLALFILQTVNINCLNQHDLCKITKYEKQCQILNKTVIRCINSTDIKDCKLKSDLSIKCEHSYCAKDMLTCEIFKFINEKVKEKEKKTKKSWKDKLEIKKMFNFKDNINNCQEKVSRSRQNKMFDWKLSQVCNNENMFDCTSWTLNHTCDDLFCTSDRHVCMGFRSLLEDYSLDHRKIIGMLKIKKCLLKR